MEETVTSTAEENPDAAGDAFAAANPHLFQPVSKQEWWQAAWFETWLKLAGY